MSEEKLSNYAAKVKRRNESEKCTEATAEEVAAAVDMDMICTPFGIFADQAIQAVEISAEMLRRSKRTAVEQQINCEKRDRAFITDYLARLDALVRRVDAIEGQFREYMAARKGGK